MNPRIIDLKRGGRLLISQLQTGEMSLTIDFGRGLIGCLADPDEVREIAEALTQSAEG